MNLSLSTAIGILRSVERYSPGDFDMLGITHEQMQKLTQNFTWLRSDMQVVMRTMITMLYGTLEVLGIPKITVPAEYIAPHIATLVDPCNRMACCVWLSQEKQTGAGALELAARNHQASIIDHTSADQLFALVCLLSDSDECGYARVRWEQVLNLRLEQAERLQQ